MEIAIVLFIVWVLVTLLGHVSWLIVSAIVRALGSLGDPHPTEKNRVPSSESDLQIARRVILRLHDDRRLDEKTTGAVLRQLHIGEPPTRRPSLQEAPTISVSASATIWEQPAKRPSDGSLEFASPLAAEQKEPSAAKAPGQGGQDQDLPVVAILLESDEQKNAATASAAASLATSIAPRVVSTESSTTTLVTPPTPRLSASEVIQSFLSAHNIRWGELVAGLLIVVCSIGLVISLWSPLVQTHRVIPSLIFLGANTAIFAAGLYTLSRWRLRHTSRAVLVIATLLVPLSVLAGLAAAGTSPDAVQLSDPITLGAILVAAVVYALLLYFGSKALSRRQFAWALAASVAGPVMTLPLAPAAVRSLGENAGWLAGMGSIAVAVSLAMLHGFKRSETKPIGPVGGRVRLLGMGFGSFSLAVAIAYLAFAMRGFDKVALLPLAIVSGPAVISLAGMARALMGLARSNTLSMVGAVLLTILLGMTAMAMPPSLASAGWLWSWALSAGLSAMGVGWLYRQPRWLAGSTIPIGIAAVLTSKIWIGGRGWGEDELWMRLISGEAMLAALLMAIVSGAVFWVVSQPSRRRWMEFAFLGWSGVALVIAAGLAVAPATLLGVVPAWVVTLVLAGAATASVAYSFRDDRAAYAATAATVFAWLSAVHPEPWLSFESISHWMLVTSAASATLLLMCEVAEWLANTKSSEIGILTRINRSRGRWVRSSIVLATLSALVALLGVQSQATAATITLVAVSLLILWAASIDGSIETLRGSQLATAALAGVVGYTQFNSWLIPSNAWSSGSALWGWAIAAGLVSVLWWLIRATSEQFLTILAVQSGSATSAESVDLPAASIGDHSVEMPFKGSYAVNSRANRIRRLVHPSVDPAIMPDGWAAALASVLTLLASAYFLSTLVMKVSGATLALHQCAWWLPVVALGIAGAASFGMRRFETSGRSSPWVTSSAMVAGIVWLACQITEFLPWGASEKLIVATTIAGGVLLGTRFVLERYRQLDFASAARMMSWLALVLIVGLASASLLEAHWLRPLGRGELADLAPTLAVAAWWLILSLALQSRPKSFEQPVSSAASAALFSSAAALVVPLFSTTTGTATMGTMAQASALAAVVWLALTRWRVAEEDRKRQGKVMSATLALVLVTGVLTSIAVTAGIILEAGWLRPWLGPTGCLLSMMVSVGLCSERARALLCDDTQLQGTLSWPLGVSLLAGQIGWLAYAFGLADGVHAIETVVAVWVATSLAATWTYHQRANWFDVIHIAGVSVVSSWLAWAMAVSSDWLSWLALGSLVAAGVQVALIAKARFGGQTIAAIGRLLGWFVGGAGVVLLLQQLAISNEFREFTTVVALWCGVWLVAWRYLSRASAVASQDDRQNQQAIPSTEFAVVIFLTVLLEACYFVSEGATVTAQRPLVANGAMDPLVWARLIAYLLAGGSAIWHAYRASAWTISVATIVAMTSLVTVRIATGFDVTLSQRITCALLTAGLAIAFLSYGLPTVARSVCRLTSSSSAQIFQALIQATWRNAAVISLLGIGVSIYMMILGAPAADIQLTIASVALTSWAIAQLADESNLSPMRYAAVAVGLVSIGLWSSVDSGQTSHPVLAASMRWLVASVLMIPALLYGAPKLIGRRAAEAWRDAFRMGAIVAIVAAIGSLASMFGMEILLRDSTGITGLPLTVVLGVGVTLAALSALAAVGALASGPSSSWRDRLNLSDQHRVALIVAAQGIGMLTWLHVYLCKPDWMFAGFRSMWPYVVMILAFATVGITEWARRRGDEVMSRTLKQTALYLPLIPVVGFWLSGQANHIAWMFTGDRVRYDVMLAIGAAYYIGIASLWQGIMPRVTAIVLGNAAWWVVLAQRPGWEFLSHPQLWVIPPAVCVLVVAHLYQDRLEKPVSAAIRYASTLLIYVSSTADMLVQQIGTNLWGPIILILLALAGMLAGVVLRVRPFLYLGAMFVLLGVTSMVWHAQRAFESVWPWWVFGISTGLCLLIGLMVLEKYKPTLRQYADRLTSWES